MSETIEFVRINLEFSLELLVVELLFMKKHERSPPLCLETDCRSDRFCCHLGVAIH